MRLVSNERKRIVFGMATLSSLGDHEYKISLRLQLSSENPICYSTCMFPSEIQHYSSRKIAKVFGLVT